MEKATLKIKKRFKYTIIIIIIINIIFYHRFPSPDTSTLEPMVHPTTQAPTFSTFLITLMLLVQLLFFLENLLNAFLVLFPGIF
jgi:hypothetical protein